MAITVVIHGGAGRIREERRDAYRRGLRAACDNAYALLERGGGATDAVIEAVRTMEDDRDAFNAGTGGVPNRDGVVECDAVVMHGPSRSSGAVAAVRNARNPVRVAERVRRESPHALIVGAGAEALVDEPIANEELLTPYTRAQFERWRAERGQPEGSATVGAVALDARGELAAATSTGGILGKWPGRVGDAPLVGAGTYADDDVAVSCTGDGEAFLRAVAAHAFAARLRAGEAPDAAVRTVLEDVRSLGGVGGMITLRRDGTVTLGFNSEQMAYGWRSASFDTAEVATEAGTFGP